MQSNSRTTTVWPADIPRAERLPLDTGHGSFCLHRTHVGDEAANDQRVRLTSNLFVLVRRGSAILEQDGTTVLLQEGDGSLVSTGEFLLTEIPRRQTSHGEILFFFFNDAVIGSQLPNKSNIDCISARLALPQLPFYPVKNFGRVLATASAVDPLAISTEFSRVFTCLLNSSGVMLSCFLKKYFSRRLKLDLFLEENIFEKPNRKSLESRYPDGARAFRRECDVFLGMKVSQWYARRRMELAYAWIRFGQHKLEDIASVLGYRDLRVLRENVERYAQVSTGALAYLGYGNKGNVRHFCTPFWFPSSNARRIKFEARGFDWFQINMGGITKEQIKMPQHKIFWHSPEFYQNPPCERVPAGTIVEPSLENFLALNTTLSDKIISLASVENWETGSAALCTEEFEQMAA